MRRPFQIKGRNGWQAEYKFADGTVQRRTFDDHLAAEEWLDEKTVEDKAEQGPRLGGPERVTLGQFLGEYAALYSVAKQGYASEIDRINHYGTAIGLPRLKVRKSPCGKRELVKVPAASALRTTTPPSNG